MNQVKEVKSFLEKNREEIVELLQKMIRIPSTSGSEADMARLVESEMERLGYDEIIKDSTGNVVGRIGNGPKKILFDAHMDTVPAGDENDWDVNPYEGVIKDGQVHGRGACDDKGCLASFIFAGKAIKDLGLAEDFTVFVTGSIMEETCEGVAVGEFLKEKGIKPDYVVIGEASEFRICRGHRGRALVEAVFKGESLHASVHDDENHAIYKAVPFIQAVPELNLRLKEDPVLGKGDICVTNVECKSNSLNSTPSECRVIIDRRTNTLDSRESILKELRELPNADMAEIRIMSFKDTTYTGKEIEAEEYFPAWALEEDHPLVQAGKKAFEDFYGRDAVIDVWGFSTDGTYTMGVAGIPTLGFGAGEGKYCHSTQDRIDIDELIESTGFYALLPGYLG